MFVATYACMRCNVVKEVTSLGVARKRTCAQASRKKAM